MTSNERLASVLDCLTHEQLVQRCVGLSRALDEANLDSDSGEARMLLERALAEMRPLAAKNVRLQRDIEAFLNSARPAVETELLRRTNIEELLTVPVELLRERYLVQKEWLASYARCLDGLKLKTDVDGCRLPADIRRAFEHLERRIVEADETDDGRCGSPMPQGKPMRCQKKSGHDGEHENGGWHWQAVNWPTQHTATKGE